MQNGQQTTKTQATGLTIKLQGTAGTREVYLNGRQLDPKPSQAIWNHSPDGFNWGYGGSGPAQLALAIMLELVPEHKARAVYQEFKNEVAKLPMDQDFSVEIDITPYIRP